VHYGTDLSDNQDLGAIDWAAAYADLAARGGGDRPFVMLKVIQGLGIVTPNLQVVLAAIRAAGFAVGGYLMDEGTADPVAEQAKYTALVGALPEADDDELPEGLSTSEYIAHLATLIAANPAALQYLDVAEYQEGFHIAAGLWLAQWNGLPGVTSYPCLMHQFSDGGPVDGIPSDVDLDVWLGSEAQFESFFAVTPAPSFVPMLVLNNA